jgi:uncharacterized lipoprotein YddW (UPF0748 family)
MNALLLVLAALGAGHWQTLDAMDYRTTADAQQAWVASDGTPQVTVVADAGRPALQLLAPFAADARLPRTVLDRRVSLDLADAGQFTLTVRAADPQAVGQVSLYFRSGEGWYSGGAELGKPGWQTLEFPKSSFHTEGQPAGWQKIDGLRISFWRKEAKDSVIHLRGLAAGWHDVALVVPSSREHDAEQATARESAGNMSQLLAELGLGADTIDDADVVRGGLGKRRVAVVAYDPHLDGAPAEALAKFVQGGGKLLACYTLPQGLAHTLGFDQLKYVAQKEPGQLAEMRFQAEDVAGLPKSVRQSSWNITSAQPAGQNARVIGRWFDKRGQATGLPALLLSDRGAFVTHLLLPGDRDAKGQLLAAILGRLDPLLWPEMAQSQVAQAGRVGHCPDLDALERFVRASEVENAVLQLRVGKAMIRMAGKDVERKSYPEAAVAAHRAHEALASAYLESQPSPPREGRGFWDHSGTGAYPGDWERTAKELSSGGFNMVFPNMLWAGVAHYPSDVLPRSETFTRYGDQLAQCVKAAHAHGIEVHVWKVNHNLSTAPRDFVQRLRREGRLQVTVAGKPQDWLCPSNPENLKLEVASMFEVAAKYDVDGLHFDYIRYPDRECCYCDGCRRRFEAEAGVRVAHWPEDCYRGPLQSRYEDWRCQQITRLVKTVHDEAKKLRPAIKISAAVFGSYPDCRRSVGQDWVAWVREGLLDFVCPMDYSDTDPPFVDLVSRQLKLVDGRVPLYPGIGAWRLGSADRVASQVYQARRLGAPGFTLFNLDAGAAETLLPGMALGIGSVPAVPPHREKTAQQPAEVTNSIGMRLVRIPAGEFMMGSGESAQEIVSTFAAHRRKAEEFKDEFPRHRVRITRPFYLGKCEVTVGDFRRFVQDSGYRTEAETDGQGGWASTGRPASAKAAGPSSTGRIPAFRRTTTTRSSTSPGTTRSPSARGSVAKRERPTACRGKPNGSMPAGRARRPAITTATTPTLWPRSPRPPTPRAAVVSPPSRT